MGSWVTYGLGSEAEDLPGFVVFTTGNKGPSGGQSQLGQRVPADGYKASRSAAAAIRSFLSNPAGH